MIRMLRDHRQAEKYFHDLEGYNGRLDAIQAAFLRVKLRALDGWNAQRRAAAARYGELLTDIADVVPPLQPKHSRSNYHLYVVRSTDRRALTEHLKARGISTGLHYPLPVHLQKCYRHWGYSQGCLPETERAASEVVSLPMFPGLTAEQQQRVANAIRQVATAAPAGVA